MLTQYWGYSAFRPLQETIIQSALQGEDCLALLPTGGGKSICYQVPALCQEGLCLVISPLIALMKDQVSQLRQRNIPAAAIYAGMSRREVDIIFENACNGAYKLLYMSPERLQTDLARERIKRMQVSLLAVDEAHCVSQWGYDFRPPYLEIAAFRQQLPGVPVLALTATATPEVTRDIQDKLGFQTPKIHQQSFARPNLSYSVLYENNKQEKLLDILKSVPGSGLIYLSSRGETKKTADFLRKKGIRADFYHAGLSMEARTQKQSDWMLGKTRIMACTNAFGMGIDKPDVRLVVHLALPDSLEAYFQEAGRAGRDGKKSYAVLLYTAGDADNLRYNLKRNYPEIDLIRKIYQALGSYTQLATGAGAGASFPLDFPLFCQTYQFEQGPAHAALRLLEQDGLLALSDPEGSMPRVFITATRETLYDYQLRNKQADVITKFLLRAHPGIQQEFMEISIGTVARYTQLTPDVVHKTLEAAHQEGIIVFQAARQEPYVTFLKDRVAAENLEIDFTRLKFRKKRAEARIDQAIQYAETLHCRSRQLLAYFGEPDAEACGICDVCTGRNQSDVPEDLFVSLERKIRVVLKKEALPASEVLKAFSGRRQEEVARVIGYLIDEGKLVENEDGLLHISSQ
ncbi:MAG: RecQ family ATP-dependent DNA helicase [Lewinellaceae bacterium]|nr:RecQ family ATP-dependent DNA helicase [Saprospiraceae bacterium]MCB9330454.1 RecQ family ATP-dependent DNA helicase [Lewinellaceae bacterium]